MTLSRALDFPVVTNRVIQIVYRRGSPHAARGNDYHGPRVYHGDPGTLG